MLPKIDLDQLVVVYMTLEHNPALLQDNPPLARVVYDDPALAADAKLTAASSARYWDIYKEVIQLSFRHNQITRHFLLCDDIDKEQPDLDTPTRQVEWFLDEESLIRAAFDYLWDTYGNENQDGRTTFYRLMAGWETHRIVWPILANRALKYRIKAPSSMLTDPEKRWPTVYGLADLSTIYSQAAYSRTMPSLGDVLRYWGFWEEGMGPRPSNIQDTLCEDPLKVIQWVEPYLVGMQGVMSHYYSIPEPVHSDLVGVPIPPAMPLTFYGEKQP